MKALQTWHYEMLVVVCVAFGSALAAGGGFHLLAALAVVLTFGHAQIADRLHESQKSQLIQDVECAWKLQWYLVGKEICWLTLFALTGQWTALVSVPLFLLYPAWRRWWRTVHPKVVG